MNKEFSIRRISILIPAYNPDQQLLTLISGLIAAGFESILVIDDGSKTSCVPVFDAVRNMEFCCLVRHDENLGKGRALKTGLDYLQTHVPDIDGVVTCDADGQHLVEDVVRVARVLVANSGSLILGVRDFDSNVPLRSRLGNAISRCVFYLLLGKYLSDTQTGLRGIPASLIPQLVHLEGERYEFEMNMLIATKIENIPVLEEKISTVYIENNKSSHFNPLLDSMRIYALLLRFCFRKIERNN
jgi:glycosyltransferase involved in cell wall biosynthesis